MKEPKRGRGRPSQDKITCTWTIDRKIAEYIESMDEGKRSKFVNDCLKQHPDIAPLVEDTP